MSKSRFIKLTQVADITSERNSRENKKIEGRENKPTGFCQINVDKQHFLSCHLMFTSFHCSQLKSVVSL